MIQTKWNWFIWLMAYGALHIVPNYLIRDTDLRKALLLSLEMVFWLLLLSFLRKQDGLSTYGLCLPNHVWDTPLLLILAIPVTQWLSYGAGELSVTQVLHGASGVLGEELLFRSLLPKYIRKKYHVSLLRCTEISSGLFGIFHMVNLLSGTDVRAVMLQCVYAFCAGLGFGAMAFTKKSIWVGFVFHALINLTATSDPAVTPLLTITTLANSICLIAYAGYHFHRMKREEMRGNETIY